MDEYPISLKSSNNIIIKNNTFSGFDPDTLIYIFASSSCSIENNMEYITIYQMTIFILKMHHYIITGQIIQRLLIIYFNLDMMMILT